MGTASGPPILPNASAACDWTDASSFWSALVSAGIAVAADELVVLGRDGVAIEVRSGDDFVGRKLAKEGLFLLAGTIARRRQTAALISGPPQALMFDGRDPRCVGRNGEGGDEEPASN
jgi:hypothetical protein